MTEKEEREEEETEKERRERDTKSVREWGGQERLRQEDWEGEGERAFHLTAPEKTPTKLNFFFFSIPLAHLHLAFVLVILK